MFAACNGLVVDVAMADVRNWRSSLRLEGPSITLHERFKFDEAPFDITALLSLDSDSLYFLLLRKEEEKLIVPTERSPHLTCIVGQNGNVPLPVARLAARTTLPVKYARHTPCCSTAYVDVVLTCFAIPYF